MYPVDVFINAVLMFPWSYAASGDTRRACFDLSVFSEGSHCAVVFFFKIILPIISVASCFLYSVAVLNLDFFLSQKDAIARLVS